MLLSDPGHPESASTVLFVMLLELNIGIITVGNMPKDSLVVNSIDIVLKKTKQILFITKAYLGCKRTEVLIKMKDKTK